jgi:hypothetical protein
MRIGVDVDGIIANFFSAYEDLVADIEGVDRFPARYPEALPPVWFWPEHYGYSKDTIGEAWRRIKADGSFWRTLGSLPKTAEFLEAVTARDQVYFVTDRPGIAPQDQTAQWLIQHGAKRPAVIISGAHANKGQVCRGLALTHYVDDKGENILDVLRESPETQVYLLAYPYNEHARADITALGGHVIFDVMQFADAIGV